MPLNIIATREKTFRGAPYKCSAVQGTPADNASWFCFDDEQCVRDRHWHVRPGDVVLDVGAAFGSYTLPALALGAARVYAFSPADFDTELLTANLVLNGWLDRCEVVRIGVDDRAGYFDSMASEYLAAPIEGREALPVQPLDTWAAGHPEIDRVDWLKMDVEGAELRALHGGRDLIRKYRPRILVENHQFHSAALEPMVRSMVQGWDLGYEAYSEPHHGVSHTFFWIPGLHEDWRP